MLTSAVTIFWRCKERSGTVIEPISNPRPLPDRLLPKPLPWVLRTGETGKKLGRNKIRFASCGPNFVDSLLPALSISPYNQNVNTELSEFLGCRDADSARSTRNKRRRIIVGHLQSLMANKASTEEYDIVIIGSGSTRA
jgi:hypothetical protein